MREVGSGSILAGGAGRLRRDKPLSPEACAGWGAAGDRRDGREGNMGIVREFYAYVRVRKKFWLLPVMVVMIAFGGLVVLTHGSAIAPFIYTLF